MLGIPTTTAAVMLSPQENTLTHQSRIDATKIKNLLELLLFRNLILFVTKALDKN